MEHILFIKERFHVGGINNAEPVHMLLKDIQKFEDGAVWLRYEVKNGGGK
jgi:hypothetical protein